jgi:drug/metabolite transporter (DMT)-like permease
MSTTLVCTLLALCAFAGNSLLARIALGDRTIDASAFTAIRLAAGAATLAVLVALSTRRVLGASFVPRWVPTAQSWRGAVALFAYAWLFSLAYVRIGAAVGALVLFGSVQLTMFAAGFARGERPGARAWLGLLAAAAGLVWLLLPAATRPDPAGFAMMAGAGVAWGVYTLLGRTTGDPITTNARHFVASVPFAIAALVALPGEQPTTSRGVWLAVASGALTSGLGYVIWYRALAGLQVATAAIAQLSVPVLAAFGAVAWLGEALSLRLVAAGALVLGGVALAMSAALRTRRAA